MDVLSLKSMFASLRKLEIQEMWPLKKRTHTRTFLWYGPINSAEVWSLYKIFTDGLVFETDVDYKEPILLNLNIHLEIEPVSEKSLSVLP